MAEEITYTDRHWKLLEEYRDQAVSMMKPLSDHHISSFVYGSIARGDIREGSDVDVFIPNPPSSLIIETILNTAGIHIAERKIVQATPGYAAKGYLTMDDRRGFSFPLVEMRPIEAAFTRFAGQINLEDISKERRVPGVNKDLKLITPYEKGHTETSIKGMEGVTAKILDVKVKVINERIRVLERRSRKGRTGVFVDRVLAPEEAFSSVFEGIIKNSPALRRRLRKR